MLDIRLIREQPEFVRDGLQKLYADPSLVDDVLRLDEERRALQTEVDDAEGGAQPGLQSRSRARGTPRSGSR